MQNSSSWIGVRFPEAEGGLLAFRGNRANACCLLAALPVEKKATAKIARVAVNPMESLLPCMGSSPLTENLLQVEAALGQPEALNLRRDLKHRPAGVNAAVVGGAVEIASGIDDQAVVGKRSVRVVPAETVQHPFAPISAPARGQLEHRPVPKSAAVVGGAVDIASGIDDQAAIEIVPSVPLALKLCSTCSVQPPRCLGDNSTTDPL
jgi:hypothetical protein